MAIDPDTEPPPANAGPPAEVAMPPREKRCRACSSPMPAAANKCIACGSVQNWERVLTPTSAILGLLVAAAGIAAFAAPIWKHEFHHPSPQPNIALVDDRLGDRIHFTISNGGDAPMTVTGVTFNEHSESHDENDMVLDFGVGSPVIKPNDITLVSAKGGSLTYSGPPCNCGPSKAAKKVVAPLKDPNEPDFVGPLSCDLQLAAVTPSGRKIGAKQELKDLDCDIIPRTLESSYQTPQAVPPAAATR